MCDVHDLQVVLELFKSLGYTVSDCSGLHKPPILYITSTNFSTQPLEVKEKKNVPIQS